MTLSMFLRDYLYNPLGGSRAGEVRRWIAVMTVMLLGGLWHGASWTFVVWGGAHGLLIAASHVYRRYVPVRSSLKQIVVERTVVFATVSAVWALFRAETFGGALRLLSAMIDLSSLALPGRLAIVLERTFPGTFVATPGMFPNLARLGHAPDLASLALLFISLAACFVLPNTRSIFGNPRTYAWPNLATAMALGAAAGAALVLAPRSGQFIYFQF